MTRGKGSQVYNSLTEHGDHCADYAKACRQCLDKFNEWKSHEARPITEDAVELETDAILRAYENGEADAALTIEALVELIDQQSAAIQAMPTEEGMKKSRPNGDAGDALDWALDHMPKKDDLEDFLEAWREGRLEEYPDFLKWVAFQQKCAAEALSIPLGGSS